MPFAQFSEQQILKAIFGNVLGKVTTGIAAAATLQTSVTAGTFASGGATTTTWLVTNPTLTSCAGCPTSMVHSTS